MVKDAGDDPDVTHGALVLATVRAGAPGSGVTFRAGEGVGTVTRAGLPIPPGEPAINPVPRRMIRDAIAEVAAAAGRAADAEVEIAIPGGEALAAKTLNGRLGIVGGLSILGTTGIVVPYSCSAWIHSIHRGIDVARAAGLTHIAGATGASSEAAVQKLYDLPEIALIDMGDFVGGMLKYLRTHPVPRVTIAGGVAKMTKLAQGLLDLHSKRGVVDSRAARRAGAGGRRLRKIAANVSSPPTRRRKLLRWRKPKVSRSATRLRAPRRRRPNACVAGARHRHRDRPVRPRGRAGRPRAVQVWLDVRSTATSAEPAAIIGVIERAVAKILRGERAADEDERRALDPRVGDLCGDVGERAAQDALRPAELACTTTAAGQSAP